MQSRLLNRAFVSAFIVIICALPSVVPIKCRSCLPCKEENKHRFLLKKDEVVDNCKVCITAEVEYQGYSLEGRGCMQRCPAQVAKTAAEAGFHDKISCCYTDLCNNRSYTYGPHGPLTVILAVLISIFISTKFR